MKSKQAFIWLAMSFFAARTNSIVPELVVSLSPEEALKLIRIFEGRRVRFPELSEVAIDIKTALCVYQVVVEGKSWEYCKEFYNLNGNEFRTVEANYRKWLDYCERNKFDPHHMLKRAEDVNFKE